ncbi:LmbE family N-acetylglucosaminyl deacetylase [Paenibacillus taihuensis]|uniref:LmbE family N-acetylglucosaminyl deacetylase n=1 Tax=Paenibacillus taihuensis TaxID=1156355 RepID=A0A3D9S7P1_9BACL|nr:PIG-L deacetylase family protein [Paenibacillus taihuensis]REE89044.1 LmbE family N-acetylglucosaminyl deacetylase [Paenibacillus taihuensis]
MNIKQLLGLPDLLDVKRIICVQPHPDDNEVGAAGTLRELALRGVEIVYITVTDGSASGSTGASTPEEIIRIRESEKQAAGQLLGVTKQINLGFPDMGGYSEDDVLKKLIPIIRDEKPDMLMTVDPWMPYEAHPDHIKTGKAVATAMLFAANRIRFPEGDPHDVPQIAFYATSHPNTFIDVTAQWETKLASILAHKSQFDNAEWPMLRMYFEHQAAQLHSKLIQEQEPVQAPAGFAEAFKVLAAQQLHFFPAALYS